MSPTCRCTWPTTVLRRDVRLRLARPATWLISPARSSGAGPPSRSGRRCRPTLAARGRRRARCRCRRGRAGRSPRRCRGRRRPDRRARDREAGGGAGELLAATGAGARSGRGRRGGRRGARPGSRRGTSRSSPPAPSAARSPSRRCTRRPIERLVEGDGAVEVGDGQLDGAEAQRAGEDRSGGLWSGSSESHGHRIAPPGGSRRMAGRHRCMDFPRAASR